MSTYQLADGRTALLNKIPAPLFEPDFEVTFEVVLPNNEEGFQLG